MRRPARPASWPSKVQLPVVGLVEAGEQVEEGRLAGAVRTDERRDGAPLDLEVVDVDRDQAAEAAPHAVDHEDRIGLRHAGLGRDAVAVDAARRRSRHRRSLTATSRLSPRMPCGRKIISSIRPRPTRISRTMPTSFGHEEAWM